MEWGAEDSAEPSGYSNPGGAVREISPIHAAGERDSCERSARSTRGRIPPVEAVRGWESPRISRRGDSAPISVMVSALTHRHAATTGGYSGNERPARIQSKSKASGLLRAQRISHRRISRVVPPPGRMEMRLQGIRCGQCLSPHARGERNARSASSHTATHRARSPLVETRLLRHAEHAGPLASLREAAWASPVSCHRSPVPRWRHAGWRRPGACGW